MRIWVSSWSSHVSVTHPELKVVSCIYLLFFFFLHFRLICCWKILYLPMLDYGIYRKIDNLPGSFKYGSGFQMLVYFEDISQKTYFHTQLLISKSMSYEVSTKLSSLSVKETEIMTHSVCSVSLSLLQAAHWRSITYRLMLFK